MRKPRSDKGKRLINMPFCQIYNMYIVKKMPASAIAELFGCEKSSVLRRMRSLGMKVRHHNDTKRGAKSHNRKSLDDAAVISMYLDGINSQASVARAFGVSSQVISRILRENGVDKKSIGECRDYKKENHPGWNPLKTDEERVSQRSDPNLKTWRNEVFIRDGFSCRKCGDCTGGNLNAHHISPYWNHADLRTDLNNGITLCQSCHTRFHTEYGWKHFTADDFSEFMK